MKLKWVLLFTVIALGVHGYLTFHYYPLHFGMLESNSACSINETLDCDAVAASSYSQFLGIPISLWGFMTHIALLIFLIASYLFDEDKNKKWLKSSYFLSLISLAASVVMAVISVTALQTFCLFCISLYILSIIIFLLLQFSVQKPFSLFSTSSTIMPLALTLIVGIPLASFIGHRSFLNHYQANKLGQMVQETVHEWQNQIQNDILIAPSLQKGPENSTFVISEFADFLCGHCKHAAPSLRSFARSHPDVQVRFYSFPLDGACNDAIGRSNGMSCRLAKAAYCANKQDLGWETHDLLFDNQKTFFEVNNGVKGLDKELQQLLSSLPQLKWDALVQCMDEEETHEAIKKQAQLGENLKIKGTPTIFVNGKLLSRGQLIPVLEGAYKKR